jgi:TetR/AcrR family transcriptional regulator, ethionamide resistance regulator
MEVQDTLTTTRRRPGGPRKGDRRREAIMEAVERLLRDRSIAELSVEEIAAAAGISRSGFYFYFESKYAALGEGLTTVWEEMALAADDFFGGSDEPPHAYVPRALTGVGELWERHEALLVGMFEASASDPGARTLWDAWLGRFNEAIAARIEAERAEGRAVAGPPDADVLARALLLMNERVFYDVRRRRLPASETARTVQALTRVWLTSIWGEAALDGAV